MQARRNTAENEANERVHTASRVRVYCSIDTSSSPVSSFLFLGAICGSAVVGWFGARRGDGACCGESENWRVSGGFGFGGYERPFVFLCRAASGFSPP